MIIHMSPEAAEQTRELVRHELKSKDCDETCTVCRWEHEALAALDIAIDGPHRRDGSEASKGAVEAAREALIASGDVIPVGEEPFTGWSLVLSERVLQAALPAIYEDIYADLRKRLESELLCEAVLDLAGPKHRALYDEIEAALDSIGLGEEADRG